MSEQETLPPAAKAASEKAVQTAIKETQDSSREDAVEEGEITDSANGDQGIITILHDQDNFVRFTYTVPHLPIQI